MCYPIRKLRIVWGEGGDNTDVRVYESFSVHKVRRTNSDTDCH